METFAATVLRDEDRTFTVSDKTQGVQNVPDYLCNVLGFKTDEVHVVTADVGCAIGSGLRPQCQIFPAALAARPSEKVAISWSDPPTWRHRTCWHDRA